MSSRLCLYVVFVYMYMYICMYVYVCACVYVCVCVCVCMCMYTCTHTHTHTHTHKHTHTHTHTYTHSIATPSSFFMSAIWHGFYPGYYLTFMSCALWNEVRSPKKMAFKNKMAFKKKAFTLGTISPSFSAPFGMR